MDGGVREPWLQERGRGRRGDGSLGLGWLFQRGASPGKGSGKGWLGGRGHGPQGRSKFSNVHSSM